MLKYCGEIGFYLLKCEYVRNLKLILEPFNDGIENSPHGLQLPRPMEDMETVR